MVIRNADHNDVRTIHKLAEEIWWPTYRSIIPDEQISFMLLDMYSENALQDQMDEGIQFLLAERDKTAVAFAGGSASDKDARIFRIHKIYILPSEQGKGTGKKLIERLDSIAKDMGCLFLELNVNRGNPAQEFYKRMGFEIHRTVDIPYHHFVLNDYVMRKNI